LSKVGSGGTRNVNGAEEWVADACSNAVVGAFSQPATHAIRNEAKSLISSRPANGSRPRRRSLQFHQFHRANQFTISHGLHHQSAPRSAGAACWRLVTAVPGVAASPCLCERWPDDVLCARSSSMTAAFHVWQRLLKLLESVGCNPRAVGFHKTKFPEPLQMQESNISDLSVPEIQLPELR